MFRENFNELFEESGKKMNELSLRIREDSQWKPIPRKSTVCTFCELNKVCIKTGTSDV
jgi:hypothetical protein